MALTNRQIIETECAIHEITESVNTYAGWMRLGFQVKKGSKALFTTEIWKPCKKKKTESDDTNNNTDNEVEIKLARQKMIMVKAAFFGLSQVEKLQTT